MLGHLLPRKNCNFQITLFNYDCYVSGRMDESKKNAVDIPGKFSFPFSFRAMVEFSSKGIDCCYHLKVFWPMQFRFPEFLPLFFWKYSVLLHSCGSLIVHHVSSRKFQFLGGYNSTRDEWCSCERAYVKYCVSRLCKMLDTRFQQGFKKKTGRCEWKAFLKENKVVVQKLRWWTRVWIVCRKKWRADMEYILRLKRIR